MSTKCKVVTPFAWRIGCVDPRVLTNGAPTLLIRFEDFPEGDSTWYQGLFSTFVAHVLHWMTHFLWTKPAISVSEVNGYAQTDAVVQRRCFCAWRLRRESRGNRMEQSRMTSPTLRSCTIVTETEHWVEVNPVKASSAVMEKHHKCPYWMSLEEEHGRGTSSLWRLEILKHKRCSLRHSELFDPLILCRVRVRVSPSHTRC